VVNGLKKIKKDFTFFLPLDEKGVNLQHKVLGFVALKPPLTPFLLIIRGIFGVVDIASKKIAKMVENRGIRRRDDENRSKAGVDARYAKASISIGVACAINKFFKKFHRTKIYV